jgi:hypothetical protein
LVSSRLGAGAARRTLPISAHGGSEGDAGRILDPLATPFQILGLDASAACSAPQLKAAFRARVVHRSHVLQYATASLAQFSRFERSF